MIGHTVSFAVTDIPMTDEQLDKAGGHILQLPVTLAAVVPVYNLSQVPKLRFSGATLADILLGKITKWNDPAIASDNPGVNLPETDIKIFPTFTGGGVGVRVMAEPLEGIARLQGCPYQLFRLA
jgi:phosphate transport system substrate-binding protein